MTKIKVGDIFLESTSLVAQTFRVNNLGDISTRQGGVSNNFSFPLTATNREALGFPEDLNETDRNPYQKVDASLYDGNVFISSGYLKITEVNNTEIKATFFSDNSGWFSEIKDLTLKDLNFSDLDHDWDAFNIRGSWSNTEGYIYPIIDYGNLNKKLPVLSVSNNGGDAQLEITDHPFSAGDFVKLVDFRTVSAYNGTFEVLSDDGSDTFTINTNFVQDAQGNVVLTLQNSLDIDQFYPGVYCKTVFEKIFENINYEIQGDLLDFFEYDNSVIPFCAESFAHGQDWIDDETIFFDKSSSQVLTSGQAIQWNKGAPTDEWDVDEKSIWTATLVVEITNTSIITPTDIFFVLIDGTEVIYLDNFTNADLGTYTGSVEIEWGAVPFMDTQEIRYQTFGGAAGNVTVGVNSTITFTPSDKIFPGNEITFNNIVPDINQADFVKYFCNLMGCFPVTDKVQNLVTFNFFRDVKANIGNALDWSDKIDIKATREVSFTEIVRNYASKSIFKYGEDDDDELLLRYKAINGIDFGSGILEIDNEFISDRDDIYEAPFTGMINFLSLDSSLYVPKIAWLDNFGEEQNEPKFKIGLIVTGFDVSELTGGTFSEITIVELSGTTRSSATAPFCWFAKAPYTTNTDLYTQSLSFGDITFTVDVEGTLSQFWEEYREALSNMKYLVAQFSLNSVDVGEIDFTLPIYIDYFKSYFYLNSINEFSGSDQLTEVELIKIA